MLVKWLENSRRRRAVRRAAQALVRVCGRQSDYSPSQVTTALRAARTPPSEAPYIYASFLSAAAYADVAAAQGFTVDYEAARVGLIDAAALRKPAEGRPGLVYGVGADGYAPAPEWMSASSGSDGGGWFGGDGGGGGGGGGGGDGGGGGGV